MICFCASCSSLSGIGAPFLYLLCIAKVTNSQLTEKLDEVNRRIDCQDETLKSIQSSLVELASAVKALIITQNTKEVKEPGPDVSLIVDAEESDDQLHNDGEKGGFPSFETVLGNCSDSLNNRKMSGNPRNQGNPTESQIGTELQGGIADKEKQIRYNGGKPEGSDRFSSITRFDLCPKKVNAGGIKVQPPLLMKNREKRNQMKRASEIIILKPGMVLMKGYISCDDQVKIVKTCREVGMGDGGFYQPGYSNGAELHFKMMCIGMNWDPESRKYSEIRTIDNSKPPKVPDYFKHMVTRAIQDFNQHIKKNSEKIVPFMSPDICIAKFYTIDGKLFHWVSCIVPESAPKSLLEATDMRDGRLNLTFRQF